MPRMLKGCDAGILDPRILCETEWIQDWSVLQKRVLKQVFVPELLYDPTLVNHEDINVFFIENRIQVSKESLILIVKKLNGTTKRYKKMPEKKKLWIWIFAPSAARSSRSCHSNW
ncbi:unnamed protein product [Caenorhabditis nigoni]